MAILPMIGNSDRSDSGNIKAYYWAEDHLLQGNNGSLDIGDEKKRSRIKSAGPYQFQKKNTQNYMTISYQLRYLKSVAF